MMSAGKGKATFSGSSSIVVKVINLLIMTGAQFENILEKPLYKADGKISGYSCQGSIYAVWNDESTSNAVEIAVFVDVRCNF